MVLPGGRGRDPKDSSEVTPKFWARAHMSGRHHGGVPIDEAAVAGYVRYFADPRSIHGSCEDYGAAATIDLDHDRGRRPLRPQGHVSHPCVVGSAHFRWTALRRGDCLARLRNVH